MLFFDGCKQEPEPAKAPQLPMPPSTQLEKFDQNWPPKYCVDDCIDISDLKNQFNINDADQENKKIINRIPFPEKNTKNYLLEDNRQYMAKLHCKQKTGEGL